MQQISVCIICQLVILAPFVSPSSSFHLGSINLNEVSFVKNGNAEIVENEWLRKGNNLPVSMATPVTSVVLTVGGEEEDLSLILRGKSKY
ncbi:hypothetical protein CDAR_321061 [Caerostris darwini]|uniref:Uncharacterized protein n=1 Tax=Caerostris darwini TaxID=1538125 RepID=A0AAV4WXF8_9ARAC|nr:hypothetical protein CDAR_321061 [Caerostris darwini]